MGLDKIILEAKHNKSESLISVERVKGGVEEERLVGQLFMSEISWECLQSGISCSESGQA